MLGALAEEELWWQKLDSAWAPRAERRYREYARTCTKRWEEGRDSRWYERRATALQRPLAARHGGCGGEGVRVRCGCGELVVPTACGLRWLCEKCQRRVYNRIRARTVRALKHHVYEATTQRAARGQQRRPVMATLTVRHSGDLAVDRDRLVTGWRKLRQWLHRRVGKFVYVLVWECTPGTLADGHVHAHVVALLPYVSWAAMSEEWVTRATEGWSKGIDLKPTRYSVRGAAVYVAKYASKGVQVRGFEPELAAALVDAVWGKRLVSASHGFWRPDPKWCQRCGVFWELVARPAPQGVARPVWWSHCGWVVVTKEFPDEKPPPPPPRAWRQLRLSNPANPLADVPTY